MKKTIITLLVVMLTLGAVLTGCGGGSETSTDGVVTVTVAAPAADESWTNDEYFHNIVDRFGMDIEFITLSADSAAEKARIMINSGDMPDMVKSSFTLPEYNEYVDQGIVKELPSDWEEKYPDLAFAETMTTLLDELKNDEGNISALVIPMDQYKTTAAMLREKYKNGEDIVSIMRQPENIPIDSYGFAFRKDWAKQLGIETQPIMEYDDFINMALKFKEADLGGVGANNVMGIAADFTEACNIFVTAFDSAYNYFYKDEETGKYICGLLTDATAQGVKAYTEAYRNGVLSKDFYTIKPADLNSYFCSQRAGIIFPRASLSYLRTLIRDFEAANPGKTGEDCIDVCWIKSPDGYVHGRENNNYYGCYYFSPEITDVKLDKLLSLANFVCSEEGGPQITLGVPGKDFTVDENGEYIITRAKNEAGTFKAMKDIYPSYDFFRQFLNTHFYQESNEDPVAKELAAKIMDAKREYQLSLKKSDVAIDTYQAEDYVKFKAKYDTNQLLADIIVSEGDIEANWAKQVQQIRKDAEGVVASVNKALLGE